MITGHVTSDMPVVGAVMMSVLGRSWYGHPSTSINSQQQLVPNRSRHPSIYSIPDNLHYAPFLGIGSGHRQLIAVTCIAEHA